MLLICNKYKSAHVHQFTLANTMADLWADPPFPNTYVFMLLTEEDV